MHESDILGSSRGYAIYQLCDLDQVTCAPCALVFHFAKCGLKFLLNRAILGLHEIIHVNKAC